MLRLLTVSAEQRNAATQSRDRSWNAPGYNALLVASVVLGAALRITQYASNRSLWRDESSVALNILGRSFGGLLKPLAFNQAAPPGFLLVEKLATVLFGKSEYALRLFPLLCGLAALPLFALLARRLLGPWAAAFATLLFACAGALTYYSAEVKQYSTDVTATLVLLLLGVQLWEQRARGWRTAAVFAAGGCIALLFSFAAVFPAVAIVAVIGCRELVRARRLTPVLAAAGAWGVASLLVVVFSRHLTTGVLNAFGSGSSAYVGRSASTLLPSLRNPPSSLAEDISGSPPLPSALYWFTVAVALVGLVALARRRPAYAGFFVGAGALMLIASSLHRYPIANRTLLFLVPIAALLLAEGVSVIATAVRRPSARVALAPALAVVVLAVPAWRSLRGFVHPQKHEEIKAALAIIRRDWRPSDTFYVSRPAEPALRYYLECGCFSTPRWPFRRSSVHALEQTDVALLSRPPNFIAGQSPHDELGTYVTDVRKLEGRRRVWLLYSHATTATEFAYVRNVLPREVSKFGRLVREFTAPGVTLYLYDLRRR